MPPLRRSLGGLLAALALTGSVTAAEPDAAAGDKPAEPPRHWLSFLVPTAFQTRPEVDFNVITEMTPAGRKVPRPNRQKPAYYIAHSMGYMRMGQGAPAHENSPPPAQLAQAMRDALAGNGYVETTPGGKPAKLVVVFYWGSYTSAGWDAEATNAELAAEAASPDSPPRPQMHFETADALLPLVLSDLAKRQELLERASLVGGVKFAAELQRVLNDEVEFEDHQESEARLAAFMGQNSGGGAIGGPALGGAVAGDIAAAFNSFNPFQRFRNRDRRTEYLIQRSFGSFYFVVASAYEAASMATNQRLLLWRTKMTVDSNGVAMMETLPRLIASAEPYFGVDMDATTTIKRRIDREGTVEIGTPTVIEMAEPEDDLPRAAPDAGAAPATAPPAEDPPTAAVPSR